MLTVVKRLGQYLFTAFLATIAIFFIVRLVPGDVVQQMMGQAGGGAAEASMRAYFGLDQPVHVQYFSWLLNVIQLDLGNSWTRGTEVTKLVADAFMVTLQLSIMTLIFATVIGLPLGVLGGIYHKRWPEAVIQVFNAVAFSSPIFWVALMLLVGVSATIGWSPPLRYVPPTRSLTQNLEIMIFPVISLGLLQVGAYSQFVQQNIISSLNQEYVRTALAKGLPTHLIFMKHILRNVSIPLVTFMGLVLVQIMGGVVIIEALFALPGLGRLMLTAIETRDFPVLQGSLLVVVCVTMLVNFLVDFIYRFLDPRVSR